LYINGSYNKDLTIMKSIVNFTENIRENEKK